MLKQFICWLKTGHKNSIPIELIKKRVNVEWTRVIVKHKCNGCGKLFEEIVREEAYFND